MLNYAQGRTNNSRGLKQSLKLDSLKINNSKIESILNQIIFIILNKFFLPTIILNNIQINIKYIHNFEPVQIIFLCKNFRNIDVYDVLWAINH